MDRHLDDEHMPPLPKWVCHKKVRAGRITGIGPVHNGAWLQFAGGHKVLAPSNWLNKHAPEVGGYYVVYEDGCASYSPKKAFETGYSPITPHPATPVNT